MIRKNEYKLTSSLKKNGLDCWRYFFSAKNTRTGAADTFFIELLIENPMLSPDKVVLSQKPRVKINPEDLQSALAGNFDRSEESSEGENVPSFVSVRGGIYGNKHRQIQCFYPANELKIDKKWFRIEIGSILFSDDTLSGNITSSHQDAEQFPEYENQPGTFVWNLHYERKIGFPEISSHDENYWLPSGLLCSYSGRIVLDSEEYTVSPEDSSGFCDKMRGKMIPSPFFYLNSNKLTSNFSGKLLQNSCFAIQGMYRDRLSFLCRFGNEVFSFSPSGKFKKYEVVSNCISVPGDEEERLHWSVSIHNKKYVCDIDVFCPVEMMFSKVYESPLGKHLARKILTGVSGEGELRIYKKIRKNLDLIHYVKIEDCISEIGTED